MREQIQIKIPKMVRDRRTERRIMEFNREQIVYYMMIVGGVLLLASIYY